jgi:hypothetical protein
MKCPSVTPWKEAYVIYVDKAQVDQVEYLLGQAVQGNHVLFDSATLLKVFRKDRTIDVPMSDEDAYAVEPHIEKLIELPTLEQKRAYLDRLDAKTIEGVVRAYFNIVENSPYESVSVRH